MLLAIVFAQMWGVVQLAVLTSISRTVRVRTAFAAMAVGFYAIGPVTAFLQLSWIHLAAPLFGTSAVELQGIASYSVDPFIEEAMKLLPLAALMLIPSIRRQWSVSDCVLIAAATGSGFGLTEHLFRYANDPNAAEAISGGWVLTVGSANVLIPGYFRTLTSWLPNGAFFYSDPIIINWHLAWSAIGGLAVGLVTRRRDKSALIAAIALFLFIGLDHATGNARHVQHTWLAFLQGPFGFFTICLGVLVLATLVAAWWLDQPSQRAGMALGPLLAAEESASSQTIGTLTAALSRLPLSIPWVYGFDRARRAYQAARVNSPDGPDDLRAALVAQRDGVEQKLKQSGALALLPPWLTSGNLGGELRTALRRPPVIIWLILIAPSVLFLIVGGWPQTAGLQRILTGPVVWPLVVLITVLSQARIAWRVVMGVRRLPATARLPIGDDAAMLGLQLACGVGAVSLGAFTLLRIASGVSAGQTLLSHAHAADAANRVTPGSGAAQAGSAGAFDPPPPTPELPDANPSADAAAAASNAPSGNPSTSDAPGDNAPAPKAKPAPPAAPPAPTPQQRADAAAAAAAQADANAQAAQQARIDAMRAADSASIKQATADPSSDPDVAAAEARTHAAQQAAEAADTKNLDGDDPWDPTAPNKAAADSARQGVRDAQQSEYEAKNDFEQKQAADAQAAKDAAANAQNAADAANAKAAEAHQNAENAHANSDAAAARAARAANPAQAAADDAAKELADAQARENDAFFGKDAQAYRDARAALDAARAKAAAAKAAADAAKSDGSSGSVTWHKKP